MICCVISAAAEEEYSRRCDMKSIGVSIERGGQGRKREEKREEEEKRGGCI